MRPIHHLLKAQTLFRVFTTRGYAGNAVKISSFGGKKDNYHLKRSKTSSTSSELPPELEEESLLFYKWPTMRHFRVLSRFKIYQVSTMLALLPLTAHWYTMDKISPLAFGSGCSAALGSTGVLFVLSHYLRRVAGELSYSPQNDTVRISTLTFWGRRKEVEFPRDEIIDFAESQTNFGGPVQKLVIQGQDKVYYWSMRHGHVLDFDLLCDVLKLGDADLKVLKVKKQSVL